MRCALFTRRRGGSHGRAAEQGRDFTLQPVTPFVAAIGLFLLG
jgi:hypothetical protein